MNYLTSRFCLGLATVVCQVGLTGCGHEQQLTSITVQPDHEISGRRTFRSAQMRDLASSSGQLETTYIRR